MIIALNKIKLLSSDIINQIAAGEVVEGPSAALKELIENSIDAYAKNIEIFIKSGGKSKIVVTDDGHGFDSVDDLKMSLVRHATSKLEGNNLFDITSYGFRGEAIPAIAAVSDFSIESISTKVTNNTVESSPINNGARVCVENIFKNIPVRMKFLKSDNSEKNKCINIVENFSITRHDIAFIMKEDNKTILNLPATSFAERIKNIYGDDIFKNALYFDENNEIARIYGFLFHPIHSNLSASAGQRLFVNNRIVKNKILPIAARTAYRNIVNSSRYPCVLLCIEVDPFYVDVNVSPTKSEVRFRDEIGMQNFVISVFEKYVQKFNSVILDFPLQSSENKANTTYKNNLNYTHNIKQQVRQIVGNSAMYRYNTESVAKNIIQESTNTKFGRAVCQLFDTYVISCNDETGEVFVIDQHAVYEKIALNNLLAECKTNNIQFLTKPIKLTNSNKQNNYFSIFEKFGFRFNTETMEVTAIPAYMQTDEALIFINDILNSDDNLLHSEQYIKSRLATIACHNSVRAGRKLSLFEMNDMLQQMENNDTIYQCNHNRPSFFKLSKNDLDKMFERV